MRFLPNEVDEMTPSLYRAEAAAANALELIESDTKTAAAYIEVVIAALAHISKIHERMEEDIPFS